ncbi:hypothetical protein MKW98_002500 [Papaver atlanticum]|uniref:Uncharacterized protein n=1 Tax=Papaver atlanticum TaxID=357466 RepID=A0AAD4XB45_9MAGN|nr:hypothetical protein MKW98_002500 [Papaver atlanticum]
MIPCATYDLMLCAKDASTLEGSKQEFFLSAQYVVSTSELETIMPSHKSFKINKKLFKKMRHNRPINP